MNTARIVSYKNWKGNWKALPLSEVLSPEAHSASEGLMGNLLAALVEKEVLTIQEACHISRTSIDNLNLEEFKHD